MRGLFIILLLAQTAILALAQKTAAESFKESRAIYETGDKAVGRRALEQTISLAVQQQDARTEAEARFFLSLALTQIAQYGSSDVQCRAALTIFERLGDKKHQATAYSQLGSNAYATNPTEARRDFEKAMELYESVGELAAVANEHRNLAFVTSGAEKAEHIQKGLELARKAGAKSIEGLLLHSWADDEYDADNFDAAFERLNQAQTIFEELGSRNSLARVLTSMGRLYRVHGHPKEALSYYQRARDILQEIGDVQGVVQSLNAMGVSLNNLGRSAEALRYNQQGLQLARESGSQFLIKSEMERIAECDIHLGRYGEAASILEEAQRIPPPRIQTLLQLSEARFRLGRYESALQAVEEGLALGSQSRELSRNALEIRAQALWKLGRTQEALSDVRKMMESVDNARANLVATDFMKQGFSETDRNATSLSIHVLLDNGEEREALESAERARSRAFLDLLATKSPSSNTPSTSIPSSRSLSSPATAADAIAIARRLDSTILSYWVDDISTTIWVVSPEGRITRASTDFGAPPLERWINEALHANEKAGARPDIQLASRGGEALVAARDSQDAWRKLYDALIRPVRANLPSKPGSRLTIIPSGPLFRLSFAALRDERGRYLIENYAFHFAPAIEIFQFALRAQQRAATEPARYLLVANPSAMPQSDGKSLPALPGSENEVQHILRFVPTGSATLLQRQQADEVHVREAMRDAKVIHLATHGVIDSRNPLNSYLALGRSSDEPSANGRLTAEEVYSLNLRADLVVLSACRTGVGQISGDGVAGLARAFFYAGAASVISTLWDVADQPTAELLTDFYRSFSKTSTGKSEALRQAQLHLLQSLRKGQLRVDTPFGKLPLPEDPVLWAGFVLMGEP